MNGSLYLFDFMETEAPGIIQLMPLSEILDLYSCDSCAYGDWNSTVAGVLPSVDISGDYHKRLKTRMAELSINRVPILVYRNTRALGNGHHRVKIAHELGWSHMQTTTNGEDSGWRPDLKGVII